MAYTSRLQKGRQLTNAELDNNFLCHWPVGSIYLNATNDQSPREIIGYGTWSKMAKGYCLVSANSPALKGNLAVEGSNQSGVGRDQFGDSPKSFNGRTSAGQKYIYTNSPAGTEPGSAGIVVKVNSPSYFSPGFKDGSVSVSIPSTGLPEHTHWLADKGDNSQWLGQHRGGNLYSKFDRSVVGTDSNIGYDTQSYFITGNGGNGSYRGSYTGSINTDTVGNALPHNNLQPYITVNIWERIS